MNAGMALRLSTLDLLDPGNGYDSTLGLLDPGNHGNIATEGGPKSGLCYLNDFKGSWSAPMAHSALLWVGAQRY